MFAETKTSEVFTKFVADLATVNVKLPLRLSETDCGTVLDAADEVVFVVDVNRERDDTEVARIALWIILAVNTCGGFKVEARDNG